MALKAQLADGKGNRTVFWNTTTGFAAVPSYLTTSTVEPVTCVVCHDPHNEGKMISISGGVTTDTAESIPTRIQNNTDLLPAGFMASGVGRGAQCIFCHNSRNGNYYGGGSNNGYAWNTGLSTPAWQTNLNYFTGAYLHEDGDLIFGTNTAYSAVSTSNATWQGIYVSYTAPHAACQGDVLMGRNAYFLGTATPGQRSKHSFIADTCVTCHMTLTKAPAALRSATAWSANHTFTATIAETCKECHGEKFEGENLPIYFASRLSTLSQEIAKAVYRIKNGANPPAGTTVSFTAGRTPAIVVNGVSTNLHTSTNTGYLDGVAGLTLGYDATIAKLNWNYELLRTGAGNGTHNPDFTWKVFDASIAAAKAR
jgi:cytochrome c553